ncbi:AAA family ATPase [uncultured Veillonella sp.]|uniref:AAA family ATPase n=1 Tax=uncultured Veillonella sp. TaxID=159268 RepID=UPI0026393A17|nr:AAA family ATPase [uncultured Veillonella sp.]
MDKIKCIETLTRYSIARIPFIAFNTIERARATDILKEVARDLNLPFYVHTMSKGMSELLTNKTINEDRTVMGALDFISEQIRQRENLTFVLTEAPDIENDSLLARYFFDVVSLAELHGAVIIVITSSTVWPQLQRLGMSVELEFPNEEEMYQIIKDNVTQYSRDIQIEWDESDMKDAASTLAGVSQMEAQNIIASLIAKRSITKADLTELKFMKNKLVSTINGLEKIDVSADILDIGGLESLKNWLNDKKKLQNPEKREELKRRGLQPPRGILLVGVPGCGKSLTAEAVAASWQLPLYRLDFATVQGQYVGQSEQQLKAAFTTAEQVAPCVLWIDEIEKGLSGAGSDSSGVTNRLVGQFLFWMQECKKLVFVAATANDVSMLPSELLRRGRFDELFFVDLPTEEERKEILTLYLRKYLKSEVGDELMKQMVDITNGFTGADLESSIRDIAYRLIANEGLELTEELILTSLTNVVPLSKTSPEKIEAIRDWGRERAVPASGVPIGGREVDSNKLVRKVLV